MIYAVGKKNGKTHRERPRVELEREVLQLRAELKWAYENAAPLADSRVGLKERVRRLNRYRDRLEAVLYPIASGAANSQARPE